MKKNAVVGQSGGPTAVINASLYGTVYEALNREDEIGTVYGMINGIEGFLNDQVHYVAIWDAVQKKDYDMATKYQRRTTRNDGILQFHFSIGQIGRAHV